MINLNRQALGRTLPLIAAVVLATVVFGGSSFAQNAAGKPTAAVYIMGNPREREVIAMSVWSLLENSGKFNMIDIDAIDLLIKEHIRQEDNSSTVKIAEYGKNAGAQWVCVVQISEELDGVRYISTRMVDVENKIGRGSKVTEMTSGTDILRFLQKQVTAMLGDVWGGGGASGGRETPKTETVDKAVWRVGFGLDVSHKGFGVVMPTGSGESVEGNGGGFNISFGVLALGVQLTENFSVEAAIINPSLNSDNAGKSYSVNDTIYKLGVKSFDMSFGFPLVARYTVGGPFYCEAGIYLAINLYSHAYSKLTKTFLGKYDAEVVFETELYAGANDYSERAPVDLGIIFGCGVKTGKSSSSTGIRGTVYLNDNMGKIHDVIDAKRGFGIGLGFIGYYVY
ncbi:MAG: hypothetical protein LBC59_05955 [Chitinispirillales bacterium]|jgi:hypothetical protein|nr:hypothetical protein [Chitinispirillales bacterium]